MKYDKGALESATPRSAKNASGVASTARQHAGMAHAPGRPFAVFDIDGTLIRWQLYHAIVDHLAKRGHIPAKKFADIQAARITWKTRSGAESFRDYEHALMDAYHEAATQIRPADYLAVVDEVFEQYKDQVYTFTRDLILDLKAKNYLLFAISGSHEEIIAKLAKHYGFDDYHGTILERKDGAFTGKLDSPYGKKAEILSEMIARHGASAADSIGVGDSMSDADMLELVEHPIAFNPEQKLFDLARQRGWEVVIERKNVVYQLEASDGNYIVQ